MQGKLQGSVAWRDVGLGCCGWGCKSHVEALCGARDAMEVCLSLVMNVVLVDQPTLQSSLLFGCLDVRAACHAVIVTGASAETAPSASVILLPRHTRHGQAVAAAQTRPPPPLASHAATHVIAEATLTVPDPIAVARALYGAIPCGADILRWIIHPRDPNCQATLSLLSCIA